MSLLRRRWKTGLLGALMNRVSRIHLKRASSHQEGSQSLSDQNEETIMKCSKIFIGVACVITAAIAYAGGTPDFVKFPAGYDASFTNYATMNRSGSAAVAKMYANDIAVSSYKKGKPAASGSVIVMEVYKPKMDDSGKPIVGSDGLNEIAALAAIAVMERRDAWSGGLSQDDQVGDWAFAIYNPDGTPKQNDLTCVACHTPLKDQGFLFSHQRLVDSTKY